MSVLESPDCDGLNERQRAAVHMATTPLCIRAGAGTGKTRVLTRRIAYQADAGNINPQHTLALTFTRKAAGELQSRLVQLGLRGKVQAGTFHSIAYAQLQDRWAAQNQRPPELLTNRLRFLKKLAAPRSANPELLHIAGEIDWAKARAISPDSYPNAAASYGRRSQTDPGVVGDLYLRYEDEKRKRRLVDFDDLLILARRDLQDDPQYGEARRWLFRHLFVDEFQDVNRLQFELLQAWLGDNPDLCVVGDPNQAIYAWNGADPGYIERFDHWFPGAQITDLTDNYRSSPQILATGHAVLPAGSTPLQAHRPSGPPPTVTTHFNHWDEATAIAQALQNAKAPDVAWSSMAVLARTNTQTEAIASALRQAGIPFHKRTDTHQNAALAGSPTAPSKNQPNDQNSPLNPNRDGVDVATFHAAKGLEWDIVHLAGLEQGLVPVAHAEKPEQLSEERRLLYVAITRAQRELHCHWAMERTFGERAAPRSPSPYLTNILKALAS